MEDPNRTESAFAKLRRALILAFGVILSLFTVFEVNFARLAPLSQLAVFAMLGMALCFLRFPLAKRWADIRALRALDLGLALATIACCTYLIVQGNSLGQRAGAYTSLDIVVGTVGIVMVLEATRRSIGLALPILASVFIAYALFGSSLPDWLFSHRGYGVDRIVAQTFLRTEGVFGTALRVMFTYVYLFVVFGAFLEASGATQYIIDFAQRVFGNSPGGPAKVAVLGSGLMGSLSGSAVANAVTTGTFTIPMMRSAGFSPPIAAGITAAAASGGALVPPVMGAGAYMMLEIIDPPVTFIQIAKAALIPAILYYLSIFLIVHFFARRLGAGAVEPDSEGPPRLLRLEGFIFFGALASLIGLLVMRFSPFAAVTYSLLVIVVLSLATSLLRIGCAFVALAGFFAILYYAPDVSRTQLSVAYLAPFVIAMSLFNSATRMTPRSVVQALVRSAQNGVSLVSASACVGIIIGVVTLTGVGTAFPAAIVPLAERSLFLALVAIMFCSIILGMGLPSAVCYLLMATLIGPVLNKLGVIPLAAHLFIFYFGMMSMVTPPVALAAYASASIAGSKIMPTGLAAFRFSLVGFTLPFMFVYRPELLLMNAAGDAPTIVSVVVAVATASLGITALAAAIAGHMFGGLTWKQRAALFLAASLLLFPDDPVQIGPVRIALFDTAGAALLAAAAWFNWRASPRPNS